MKVAPVAGVFLMILAVGSVTLAQFSGQSPQVPLQVVSLQSAPPPSFFLFFLNNPTRNGRIPPPISGILYEAQWSAVVNGESGQAIGWPPPNGRAGLWNVEKFNGSGWICCAHFDTLAQAQAYITPGMTGPFRIYGFLE
jgi:hypothetical protein